MKVLFAVNNENISEAIIKMYQRDYKEIITYKNVYYFNAILKELQKDKSYDRVVISEDLEPFANNNYDTIDKFIFEKLDKISDEATNGGVDIPIILICTDRRTKSEQMLVKIFGIGIYNAILGDDRSVEEVCSLIKSPRNKKEAKDYYKIDTEDVGYQSESEDTVSEVELQNILAHYKRLGKDESRYVESFNNIAAQYNDNQLRLIARILPINVKAVLEANSPKYQSVMTFRDAQYNQYAKEKNEKKTGGLNIGFIKSNKNKMTKPVVIPSAIDMQNVQKIGNKVKPIEEEIVTPKQVIEPKIEEIPMPEEEEIPVKEEVIEQPKRGRGRPKKQVQPEQIEVTQTPKKGRGRPKKQVDTTSINTVNLFDLSNEEDNEDEEVVEQVKQPAKVAPKPKKTTSLFDLASDDDDYEEEEKEEIKPNNFTPRKSPLTFESREEKKETSNFLPGFDENEDEEEQYRFQEPKRIQNEDILQDRTPTFNNKVNSYDSSLDNLLTGDKKIISFVGTSKNGTSFLVNNLGEMLSSMGIKTAILDATKNKNSFYIYTKNEETLRKIAYSSFENLRSGRPQGIDVNKYLTIYTSLPGEDTQLQDYNNILTTLIQNYSAILIDCDFETDIGYFEKANEIYLVQSMDILTIQPLTAFLRDLKSADALRPEKLRVIINKQQNVKTLTEKAIVGGLAYYNDPAMSFMTELFNKETMKYYTIPFDIQVY